MGSIWLQVRLLPPPHIAPVAQLGERFRVKAKEAGGSTPSRSLVEAIMDDRIVFHFNKASIGQTAIPPWVIKHRGQTYYVWHLTSSVRFSTKETPNNPHTQGSIQFRGSLELREEDGKLCAFIT